MKKVVLVLGLITMALSSCKKEVDANSTSSSSVTLAPCVDCDEIIEFFAFAGGPQGYYGDYVSINQCTGDTVEGSWYAPTTVDIPYVGQCWE